MTTERIWPKQSNLEEYLKEYPEHKQRYLLASRHSKGSNCADISCGAGYGSYILGEFANSVIGYDLSSEALKHAESNFTRENVSFKNINELKNIKFDLVVSLETLEHMSEKDGDEFLRKIAISIKSNGKLIISTPLNETQYKENVTKYHIREYSNEEFKKKLESIGFYIEQWLGQSNIVSERVSKEIMGISILKLLNTGLHRLLPKIIRKQLSKLLLNKNSDKSNPPSKIKENNLNGAFCQIAICRLK